MKVKVIRDTFVNGDPVEAGIVDDFPETIARNLIAGGKAVPIDEAEEKAPENRSVGRKGTSER